MKNNYSLEYLFSLVSENKKEVIQRIIKNRTRYFTVVLEDINQPHNASAVLRSCDIFGIQDVNVIEQKHQFIAQNEISKGASKWVDVHSYDSITSCAQKLKKDGYTLVATTPHEKGYSLPDLPIDKKMALLFGTETTGLSDHAFSLADEYVTIPMFGFTESFNISVSVSICLYQLIMKLHASSTNWQLTEQEKKALQRVWLERILNIR